ncbi:MAG TPA: cytochrome P450 [Acidimicrobiales bacterium]|nr:cytochrome P450 [Acidimicrobiales bacterium]
MSGEPAVHYDPYDVTINADPYPTFRRLRDEAPLYYNPEHDFYALSRYEDVEAGLRDWQTFSSARGGILELIKAGVELPPGTLIFEDPPVHDIHRKLLSRVFTPRRMNALEDKVREFCARSLDPVVGTDGFDLIAVLGAQMPMRTISMLLGIPEADQEAVRDRVDANLRTEPGRAMAVEAGAKLEIGSEMFADYIDWRAEHPSDDLMTELMTAEFTDETGTVRRLTRDELLTYSMVIAGAGNETTTRLIGWAGTVLADHPDQRRELTEDPSLVRGAIEELLRYEPPAPHTGRYVTRDVELHGRTVPEGSVMLFLNGAANRDERRFADPDRFDIHREITGHLTFGFGVHFCLGAALARLEGRVALEELLARFPEWEVDRAGAKLSPTSTVRGWETLPLVLP